MVPTSSGVRVFLLLRFSGLWHHVAWCVGISISEEYSASNSVSGEKLVLFLFPLDFGLSSVRHKRVSCLNPLNAELNPICQLLALLGAHHILHVSKIRVKT